MADTKIKLPEPVGYQIRLVGGSWTHCAKHIHEAAIESGAAETRALYSADQMISLSAADNAALRTQAAGQSLRVLEMTVENAALRERVKVLEDALREADEAFLSVNPFVPNGSDADFVLQATWGNVRAALRVPHG